jgi:hypothetical protein
MGIALGLVMTILDLMVIFVIVVALVIVGDFSTMKLTLVSIVQRKAWALTLAASMTLPVATMLLVVGVPRDAPVTLFFYMWSLTLNTTTQRHTTDK